MAGADAPVTARGPVRRERLDLRIDADQKALLEHAAGLNNQSLTAFVLASARHAAEQTIRSHEVMRLSVNDAQAFVDALLDPPPPAPRLLKALEYHSAVIKSAEPPGS